MKRKKFKRALVEQIKNEERERGRQEELKEKYDIGAEEDVVIVEKSNMIKFFTVHAIGLLRFLAGVIVFLLSVTGLAALLYPESRNSLWHQGLQVYQEMLRLL